MKSLRHVDDTDLQKYKESLQHRMMFLYFFTFFILLILKLFSSPFY